MLVFQPGKESVLLAGGTNGPNAASVWHRLKNRTVPERAHDPGHSLPKENPPITQACTRPQATCRTPPVSMPEQRPTMKFCNSRCTKTFHLETRAYHPNRHPTQDQAYGKRMRHTIKIQFKKVESPTFMTASWVAANA
jgi:hypothetical protein